MDRFELINVILAALFKSLLLNISFKLNIAGYYFPY